MLRFIFMIFIVVQTYVFINVLKNIDTRIAYIIEQMEK